MAAASDELMLLERVFLRIGSAESDEQLQNAVCKFLPPVLLKLSSPQEGVRKKVMELLVHINKRLKSRPLVQLPLESLLVQYQDPSASSFVINFTIIYIKLGFPRLPMEKRAELAPTLLCALDGKPTAHQDSLFLLLMPVLGSIKIPNDADKRGALFGLSEKPRLAKQLAEFMLDVLLLPYGSTLKPTSPTQGQGSGNGPPGDEESASVLPPGLSEYALKRLLGETPMKPEELEQTKLGIVKFLSSGVLPEADILCQLVVASADSRFSVANAADLELRRTLGSLDWSNLAMVTPLYLLYLGTQQMNPGNSKLQLPALKPEYRRAPAGTRLRLKLLPCLIRGKGPALAFPLCIQVFFDSLYGNSTNTRLRGMALTFCLSIIRNVNPSLLSHVTHVLLNGLLKLLTEGEPVLKTQVYNVVGQLALHYPGLVNSDLLLLSNFMEALGKEEAQDVRLAIREALLTMVDAFRPESAQSMAHVPPCKVATNGSASTSSGSSTTASATKTTKNTEKPKTLPPELLRLQMQELLSRQIENPESMVRFVVVRYAAAAFPPDHVPSRYLLLIASADSKDEVASEALTSLYQMPESARRRGGEGIEEKQVLKVPQFPDMVQYLWDQSQAKKKGDSAIFPPETFLQVIKYLRLCLARSAGVVVPTSVSLTHPSEHTPKIGKYIRELGSSNAEVTTKYLTLVHQALSPSSGPMPILALLEVVGCAPQTYASQFVDKLAVFKNLLCNTNEEIRELAAQMFAVLVTHGLPSQSELDEHVQELCTDAMKPKALLEAQHGYLLAMAHAVERRLMHCRACGAEDSDDVHAWPTFKKVILTIVSFLDNSSAMLVGAACSSLGLLARSAELPLVDGKSDDKACPGKMDIVLKLQSIMSGSKHPSKVKEAAGKAAGYLCVGETFPHRKDVIQGFLDLAKETRDVEVHLSAGEALVCCALGPSSPESRDLWTVLESEFKPPINAGNPADSPESQWLYDTLLKVMPKDPHPNQRQACCLWLLALVKNCAHAESLRSCLPLIQSVFMAFLGENNDIVQDAASKGLRLVYESSDPELKNKLVTELRDTIISGRRDVAQVTPDTQVFTEGEIGKAPGGNNLTTYKELCELASDLNQPDLIYKFMHLANHNSIWNSKKGAAFGFSSIAALAGDQLTPHLPKIVPRLYRYQFDPTPKIQNSMASIWHSIVTDTSKTVDQYHKEILEDLINNLTAAQWRVRQSCCLAVSDFIRGSSKRSIQDDIESLPRLWAQLFRVMDDVHDGTRQAAGKTTRSLSKVCVRACDASQGKAGQEMVKAILPVLLETGICNNVSEVRSVSLQTVSQLVSVAGPQLKPHLHLLLPALLEATGELESAGLAYLSTRYGADADKQEMIDSARASAAKSHYTTETMTKCLQYVDGSILDQLMPKLLEMLRHSVRLGTRVAATHLVVLLSHPLKTELQPHTGKLLGVLVNGLLDRNAVVRKCYATAIGHIVSSAKESSIEKLLTKLQDWYFQKEDDSVRLAVGHTLRAITQHNQDLLKDYLDRVVPLIFFAMHTKKTPETTAAVEVWEDVWAEATPSTETALRLHMVPVCALLKETLQSNSWMMKAQAADAVGTLASKMGTSLQPQQCSDLVDILLAGLSGRTWEGKHSLLQALATLCKSCRGLLQKPESSQLVDSIVSAALREARKEQVDYKLHAVPAVANILNTLQVDRFNEMYQIIKVYLQNRASGETSNGVAASDAAENSKQHAEWMKLQEASFDALGKSWPSCPKTQAEFQWEVLQSCVTCLKDSTRVVQVSVVVALSSFVDRLCLLDATNLKSQDPAIVQEIKKILTELESALHQALGISGNTRIRKEALNILIVLAKKLKESGCEAALSHLAADFSSTLGELAKDNAPEVKSRVIDLKDIFKAC